MEEEAKPAPEEQTAGGLSKLVAEEDLGSEDTDEEDEDEDRGEDGGAHAWMTGTLGVSSDGRYTWKGSWAETRANHAAGKSWRVRYTGPPCSASVADGAPLQPCDGDFDGHFKMASDDAEAEAGAGVERTIEEKGVKLRFKAGGGSRFVVKGAGSNEFNTFSLDGEYDASTRVLSVYKTYDGGDDDEDDEDDGLVEDVDPEELDGLNADAELSIEELRAKYGGGGDGGSGAGGDEPPPTKRAKTSHEDVATDAAATSSAACTDDEEEDFEEF